MRGLLLLFRKPLGRMSLLLLTVLFITAPSTGSAADYSKYHNYDEMTRALRDLVNSHSRIAKLVALGETLEGRTVWAVEIASQQGAPAGSQARPRGLLHSQTQDAFQHEHVSWQQLMERGGRARRTTGRHETQAEARAANNRKGGARPRWARMATLVSIREALIGRPSRLHVLTHAPRGLHALLLTRASPQLDGAALSAA